MLHLRRGIVPMFKKVLWQESEGWFIESINTLAIPLTFFLAFGLGLQQYISDVDGMPYMVFVAPGLISMTILLEAYRTGAWGLWLDRWHQHTIDEYRIKPVTTSDIIIGQILGGFFIALIKGLIVALVLLALAPIRFEWAYLVPYLLYLFPGSILFTCLGSMVGTSFSKPDNIAQSQTIFITPLLYMGGLFFPLSAFPEWLQPVINWLPTTGLFDGGRDALLHGAMNWHYLLVLVVSSALSFVGATWLFNHKLSE
jgi:lipooligosaccharide transport system permease protein